MGKLQICICGARNLENEKDLCLPDPYCCVRLGGKTFKTKVVNNSCDPVWNQTFRFHVSSGADAQVCVELWNRGIVTDNILGSVCLPLKNLTMGVVTDSWYMLSHSETSAEVRIRLLACDFGAKPQASERWKVTRDINACPVFAAGGMPPPLPDPVTVSTNSNNMPMLKNMGPPVVPAIFASS
uniref:Uncharacterized protein TCIL3000_8_8300 n=1 Tax=Trypanosoma congolense (strain IL3000) TaxID=1068625 RepID=G0UT87_TRYCI|nr:unnamed protein product [Trypanosoma congolense IL3000]